MTNRLNDLMAMHLKLEEMDKALSKEYEGRRAALAEKQGVVRKALEKLLEDAGADSLSTATHTIFKGYSTQAAIDDYSKLVDYVVETGRVDLFQKRLSPKVVEELGTVPGVYLNRKIELRIRRK